MERFERTRLWRESLARRDGDTEEKSRDRLRAAYFVLRERAGLIAQAISKDIPELTVHDLTHLDALWEMADLITGDGIKLNPCEAFVLGGAFLLHDLGMNLIAYQTGLTKIVADPLWRDTISKSFRSVLHRSPTELEIAKPPEDFRLDALATVLRATHGKTAERLGTVQWNSPDGSRSQYLIEDTELRNSFGLLMGKIASSHAESVQHVLENLNFVLGAPAGFEAAWVVDSLKLACILRVADACHLDARRAPRLKESEPDSDDERCDRSVGFADGAEWVQDVIVIRRPRFISSRPS